MLFKHNVEGGNARQVCVCVLDNRDRQSELFKQKIRWTPRKRAMRKQLANDVPGYVQPIHNGQRLRGDDNFIITLFNDH